MLTIQTCVYVAILWPHFFYIMTFLSFKQGVLAEILEPIMGKGLIPADLDTWKQRRRGEFEFWDMSRYNSVNTLGYLHQLVVCSFWCSVSVDFTTEYIFISDSGNKLNSSIWIHQLFLQYLDIIKARSDSIIADATRLNLNSSLYSFSNFAGINAAIRTKIYFTCISWFFTSLCLYTSILIFYLCGLQSLLLGSTLHTWKPWQKYLPIVLKEQYWNLKSL